MGNWKSHRYRSVFGRITIPGKYHFTPNALDVEGRKAWVVSPEDLILLKLIASRPRDIADVFDVLLAQGQLDEEYLRNWANQLGVTSRLDDVLEKNEEMY